MLEIDAEGPLQNSSAWNLTRSSNTTNSGQKIVVLQTQRQNPSSFLRTIQKDFLQEIKKVNNTSYVREPSLLE
jgi:hypothetical protein